MRKARQLPLRFDSTSSKRHASRGRVGTPHRARPPLCNRHPVHVTVRRTHFLPSLREPALFSALHRALGRTHRAWFRVIHFSFQHDHAHLIIEAEDAPALSRGVTGLLVRLARAFNRILGRRGSVWSERFHSRTLRTPREMRNCIVYVLMNHRKHAVSPSTFRSLDACSSARWFDGWKQPPVGPPILFDEQGPVMPARTWLARAGWMHYGRIGPDESPKLS